MFNPIVALFIAVVKATIVVLFFMHVKYSSKLTKLTVGGRAVHISGAGRHDPGGLFHPRVGPLVVARFIPQKQGCPRVALFFFPAALTRTQNHRMLHPCELFAVA